MEGQQQEWFAFEEDCQETLYVTPLGENLYRLEETPVLVEQEIYLGDIIEAEVRDDGVLRFRRLVVASPWHHWSWFLAQIVIESSDFDGFTAMIEEQGGKWERIFGGLFIVHLPPESALDPEAELQKVVDTVQAKKQNDFASA